MNLSVVIVNYNSREKTANCVRSIYDNCNNHNFEVIVVDNNSVEDIEPLKLEFPGIKLIKNHINSGMGAGNNIGIKSARYEYLLILNADTEITPGAIESMTAVLEGNSTVGIVGPKLVYPDGERQVSCYRFPRFLMPIYRRTFLGKLFPTYLNEYLYLSKDLDQEIEVDWLMGSCYLMKRQLMAELRGFDERFFMYFEDTDLCRRVHARGLGVVYCPSAVVVHYHGRASAKAHWSVSIFTNRMTRIHLISWLKYFLKWSFQK
jgi:GT2 family glycosyltransferase